VVSIVLLVAMTHCPRCGEVTTHETILCPKCRTPLKAFGHPGMPLHQAMGRDYLCNSCTYHADNSCTYPQRPFARECILYHNIEAQVVTQPPKLGVARSRQQWLRDNSHWLALAFIILLSLCLALMAN